MKPDKAMLALTTLITGLPAIYLGLQGEISLLVALERVAIAFCVCWVILGATTWLSRAPRPVTPVETLPTPEVPTTPPDTEAPGLLAS